MICLEKRRLKRMKMKYEDLLRDYNFAFHVNYNYNLYFCLLYTRLYNFSSIE